MALAKGVPEKLVMERTGYRNVSSLHTYQRERAKEREAFSDVLQGVKESFLVPEPPKKKLCEASGELKGDCSKFNFSNYNVTFNMKRDLN